MKISDAMWNKAQSLIAADSFASWERSNPAPARHRARRYKPYAVPSRSADLAKALGTGDAEQVAAIMLYQFGCSLSEFDFQ
jgi:hypothetical protein